MRRLIALSCCLIVAVAPEAADRNAPRRLPENRQARPTPVEAEGTLRRNTEARGGEAPYALLDGQGRIIAEVAPDPGVKMAKLVGRRVRVKGVQHHAAGQSPMVVAWAAEPLVKGRTEIEEEPVDEMETDEPIATVGFQEEISEPLSVEGEVVGQPYYEQDPSCGVEMYGGMQRGQRPVLGNWYLRAEYLYWWTDGMYTPALVTTSPNGTPRVDAGVIGPAGTTVLFGQDGLNNNGISGGRITFGKWLDCYPGHAIEGDYWGLGSQRSGYFANSLGDPILARPFYDIVNGTGSAELVAFPAVVQGSVLVDPITNVQGAGLRKRWNLCGCSDCDPCDPCCCTAWNTDFTLGYRWMRLDDSLFIQEDLVSTDTTNPGAFIVNDIFDTRNTFNGAEVGTVMGGRNGRWSYEMLGRLALGSTHSQVTINGFTDITRAGTTTRNTGGLLAQRTNIGTYERDAFAMIPELGATIGYQLTPVWRLTFGYSFIYWSNVVRAGQQIDTDININLLPPEAVPFEGPLRPRFQFNDTDFFVQGISVGLDARW